MPYSEDKPITTKDVIDNIASKNLDAARDGIKDTLYKKSAEAMVDKKVEIAKSIGKPERANGEEPMPSIESGIDPFADVIDAPTTLDVVDFETTEPTTSEE